MGVGLKGAGDYLLGVFNFNIPRRLNGTRVIVPVRSGTKVTISGEKWMSGLLKKLFNHHNGAFLDIGVNLGQTLIKVKTIDPDRNYFGFEPNSSCLFYLQHLVSINNWENVTIVPTGVFHSDCLLNLVGEHDTHGASTVIDDFKTDSMYKTMRAKLVPLLSFSTIEKSISYNKISFIKIDVEGAEVEVMESMLETIKQHRPIILLEVWQSSGDPVKISRSEKTEEMVNLLGYKIFSCEDLKQEPYFANLEESNLGASKSDNYVLLPHERQADILKQLE